MFPADPRTRATFRWGGAIAALLIVQSLVAAAIFWALLNANHTRDLEQSMAGDCRFFALTPVAERTEELREVLTRDIHRERFLGLFDASGRLIEGNVAGRPRIPAEMDRAHTAYERVYADLTHVGAVIGDTAKGGDLLDTPWEELTARLDELGKDVAGARAVPQVIDDLDDLRKRGLGDLLDGPHETIASVVDDDVEPAEQRLRGVDGREDGVTIAHIDTFIVNLGARVIGDHFGAGIDQLQWIVDSYNLVYAASLLTGGMLADRYGRRRILMAGAVIFSAA